MKHLIRILFFSFIGAVCLVGYQNCELKKLGPIDSVILDEPEKSGPGGGLSGNGDGYTGMQYIYPREAEQGSMFSIRAVVIGQGGYSFRVIQGVARLQPYADGSGTLVFADETFIGNLKIEATAPDGTINVIEIQIIEPKKINSSNKNASFGTSMHLNTKRVVVGAPRRNVDDVENVGNVIIFNHRNETDEVVRFQQIISPVIQRNGRFGQSVNAYNKDLVISSDHLNKVFHYRSTPQEDRIRHRYELVQELTMPGSLNFGAHIQLQAKRLLVSDTQRNQGPGVIHLFVRDDELASEFRHIREITPPEGYSRFGRTFRKIDDLVLISAVRDSDEKGVLFLYRLGGRRVQTIEHDDAGSHFGLKMIRRGTTVLVSNFRRTENSNTLKEFVSVYDIDIENETVTHRQDIESTEPENLSLSFGASMATDENFLFIGAPGTDDEVHENSGEVHMYIRSAETGLFEYVANISPNYNTYDVVKKMGRSIVLNRGMLYISLMGQNQGDEHLTGSVYVLKFK